MHQASVPSEEDVGYNIKQPTICLSLFSIFQGLQLAKMRQTRRYMCPPPPPPPSVVCSDNRTQWRCLMLSEFFYVEFVLKAFKG